MKFRYDINALRALAVIAVILFHFNHNWLPGGFAGVDVFFVISGFLMTSIICQKLAAESFSLIGFYRARARRIIPALAVVVISLLLFGWIYLPPIDYQQLGKHSLSAISFFSNMTFWQEAGYFDAASHEKWLLHTWSLSVEWQFYIIYPAILLALAKMTNTKYLKYLVVLGFILSLFVSVIATFKWPSLAFYSLPTRAWEMLLGGIAFLFPIKLSARSKHVIELLGLVFICAAYWLFNGDMRWPGYLALLPTLGAFLVIIANNSNSVFSRLLLVQWFGKVSYSLYLWHWPIVVGVLYFGFDAPYAPFLGIFLSIVFAALSYYLVEKNIWAGLINGELIYRVVFKRALVLLTIVVAISVFAYEGFYKRNSSEELYQKTLTAKSDWYYPKANLMVGNTKVRQIENGLSDDKVLFLGDSLIEQYYARMEHQVKAGNSKYDVWFITNGGCFPTGKITSNKRDCRNIENLKDVLNNEKFDRIVVGGDWHPRFYIDEWRVTQNGKEYLLSQEQGKEIAFGFLEELFKALKLDNAEVYLMLSPPKGELFDYQYISRQFFLNNNAKSFYPKAEMVNKYAEFNEKIIERALHNGINIINPLDSLCGKEICSTVDPNGDPIYKDDKHLRASYVKHHVSFLDFILE